MRPEVRISDQLTEDAARVLADAAERGGHIVITGGSTPKEAYNPVAQLGADWARAELWFTDERCCATQPLPGTSSAVLHWTGEWSPTGPGAPRRACGRCCVRCARVGVRLRRR